MFSKSEKWVPVTVLIWGIIMVTAFFVAAWYDDVRYVKMMEAVGQGMTMLVAALVGAAQYYSKIRHTYKEVIIKQNGNGKQ